MELTLTELEDAINYWRAQRPSTGEERTLSPQVNALATVYAMMIFHRLQSVPCETLDAMAQEWMTEWRKNSHNLAYSPPHTIPPLP